MEEYSFIILIASMHALVNTESTAGSYASFVFGAIFLVVYVGYVTFICSHVMLSKPENWSPRLSNLFHGTKREKPAVVIRTLTYYSKRLAFAIIFAMYDRLGPRLQIFSLFFIQGVYMIQHLGIC